MLLQLKVFRPKPLPLLHFRDSKLPLLQHNTKQRKFSSQITKNEKMDQSHDFLEAFKTRYDFYASAFKKPGPEVAQTYKRPTNRTMPKVYDTLTEPEKVTKLKGKNITVNKICTYNVASVRAASVKGLLEYVKAEDPTILCLQETKLQVQPDSKNIYSFQPDYPYQHWWCSTSKKGFHGTAILSKIKPISHIYGFVQNPGFDTEGRVVTVEFSSFYLVNAYVPFVGMKLERLSLRVEWENNMLDHLDALESKGKPVIYTGDLNVAPNPIDIAPALRARSSPGSTSEERACFEKLLRGGNNKKYPRIDIDRHFHPKELNRFTAYSYAPAYRKNVWGWRFDYFIASRSILPQLIDTDIRFDCFGASDHVPSVLWLTTPFE